MIQNPNMLAKVRSDALTESCRDMPCTLRIGTFIGIPCSGPDTVVGAHLPVFGKGMATKVSDIHIIAGCFSCHNLLDWERDPRGAIIAERYPDAFWNQVFRAYCETISRWVHAGLIVVPGAKIV